MPCLISLGEENYCWEQVVYSFFLFAILPHLLQQHRQHLKIMKTIVAIQVNKNARTSREWYWYQVRW